MQKVLILGAGKIGALVSGFLAECRDYEVHVADVNGNAANSVVAAHGLPNLHACELDASNPVLLEAHLREHPADTIISSLPFYCNVKVAEAPSHGQPILVYDQACPGSVAYIGLAREIIARERQYKAA